MLLVRAPAVALALAALATAPFQCASEPKPSLAREENPAEALHGLADEFDRAGDREGRVRTLLYLAERYPRSKFAEQAKVELKELGVDFDAEMKARAAQAKASASAAPSASAPPAASSARP